MPSNVTFPNTQKFVFQATDQNGNPQGLNVGANVFTDNDGINRAHALFTVGKTLSSTLTQNGLAANTLSNALFLQTQTGFMFFITTSAAGTVTIYVSSHGGGSFYPLAKADGTALTLTMTANQLLALPIGAGVYSIAIQSSVATNITLEASGSVGG